MTVTVKRPVSVLVVDDEEAIRLNLCDYLQDLGYQVHLACDGREGLEVFARVHPDVVITDLRMVGMNGWEFIGELAVVDPGLPIIVASGSVALKDAIDSLHRGAWDYLVKPVLESAEIDVVLRRNLERARLEKENRRYQEDLEDMVRQRTRELRESQERFTHIAEVTGEWIWEVDAEGLYTYASPVVKKLLGYEPDELVGRMHFWDLFPSHLQVALRQEALAVFERRDALRGFIGDCVHKDGHIVILETMGVPLVAPDGSLLGYRGVDADITEKQRSEDERARLQEQLHQSQKLEAVGQLAGGLAHDINNMLTAVFGYTALLEAQMDPSSRLVRFVEGIEKAAGRSRDIIAQLLAFSRRQACEPRVVDINRQIADLGRSLAPLIGENIDVRFLLDPQAAKVRFDPAQLDQVMMNLVVNARDAMPDGGTLEIGTANLVLEPCGHSGPADAPPGRYVAVSVRDSGSGMDDETLARVFEPFFTTKAQGQGTGLGLSTVFGIVRSHGAFLDVSTRPAHGSTFRVLVPAVTEELQPCGVLPAVPEAATGGMVLVVEDDENLREVLPGMLELAGYRSLVASSAFRGLALCEECGPPIDVLLSDVVMPGMSGVELARQARAARPGLRVVLMSGYAYEAVGGGDVGQDLHFLAKPFTTNELARALHEAMKVRAG